jgi:hypothetical protein
MSRTRLQLAAVVVAAIGILALPAAASAAPRTPVPGVSGLDSVTCPTTRACVAVGTQSGTLNGKSAIINAATGAVKAGPGDLTNGSLNAVTCPGTKSCLAVADDAVASVKVSTGAIKLTATPKVPPNGIVAMGAVACAGAKNCYAVGFEGPFKASNAIVVHLSPAGKLLSVKKNTGTGSSAIACPSSTLCLISDYTGGSDGQELIQQLKNGKVGTSHTMPANTYVESMSCYKASLCYVLGGNSEASPSRTDELFPINPKNGKIGTMATIGGDFSAGTGPNGIHCISATTCLVVGGTGTGSTAKAAVVVVSKGEPAAPTNYKGSDFFASVGCASTSRCYAVGSSSAGAVVVKVKS